MGPSQVCCGDRRGPVFRRGRGRAKGFGRPLRRDFRGLGGWFGPEPGHFVPDSGDSEGSGPVATDSWAVIRAAQSRLSVFSPPTQGEARSRRHASARFSGGIRRGRECCGPPWSSRTAFSHRSALEGDAVGIKDGTQTPPWGATAGLRSSREGDKPLPPSLVDPPTAVSAVRAMTR